MPTQHQRVVIAGGQIKKGNKQKLNATHQETGDRFTVYIYIQADDNQEAKKKLVQKAMHACKSSSAPLRITIERNAPRFLATGGCRLQKAAGTTCRKPAKNPQR
jgi:hypothetical protein